MHPELDCVPPSSIDLSSAYGAIGMEDRAPPLNRLRALWAEDRCALGAIATIPSVQTVQILAASGLDFIIIDMEHGPIGPAEAHAMIAATQGTSLVPLARVAATTPWHAKVPLDLGVMGCASRSSQRAPTRKQRCGPSVIRRLGNVRGDRSMHRCVGVSRPAATRIGWTLRCYPSPRSSMWTRWTR